MILAVYGTLLGVHGAQDALGIRDRLRYLGAARIPGRLVDLGGFPGLVAGPGTVRVEVYEGEDDLLPLLDEFEGSSFVRELVPIPELGVTAWVYRYHGPVDGFPEVEDGDYRRGRSAW